MIVYPMTGKTIETIIKHIRNKLKYLLTEHIEVKWHNLQQKGYCNESCWIEMKRLVQILTHIQVCPLVLQGQSVRCSLS